MAIQDLNKEKYKFNENLVIGGLVGKFSQKMHEEIVPIISNIQPKLVLRWWVFKVISENLPPTYQAISKKFSICTINY